MLSNAKSEGTEARTHSTADPASGFASQAGISIPELRGAFDGRVIAPGDDDYDQARTVFPGGIDRRPAVIIRPRNAADIAQVIALARQTGLELAVRSGGHSGAGHGVTDGGIVLDLADLKALEIDAANRTAWAQTGLTAGEYTRAASDYGLATGFGDTASVGIGGITLGGGVGYLVRKHGLTIDHLLAAEIVTADGQLLRADAREHADLFWALRGGGGNFGVVTRFQYRLHEVDQIVGGILVLPATPGSIAAFIAEADAAPEELSAIVNVMPAPPMPFLPPEQHGKLILFALMAYAGPVDAAQRALAPFRSIATPLADLLRPCRYIDMFQPDQEDYHPLAVGHTLFMDTLDQAAAETILEYLQASDAPLRVAQLRVLGGAVSRVPVDATAYAFRTRRIMANLAAFYTGPADLPVRQAWLADFIAALPLSDNAAYVNFLGDEGAARVHDAYPGATWDRLAAVKARYDPANLFHLNQNIPPASRATR